MATRINTAARNAACDGIVDLVDGGTGAGVLRVYTGTQPAGPGTAPSGTLLVSVTLGDPAFGASNTGVATLDVSTPRTGTVVADGTAGWFRVCDSTEAAGTGLGVFDGSVTATGGGGDLTVGSTSFSTGATFTVSSLTYTVSAS